MKISRLSNTFVILLLGILFISACGNQTDISNMQSAEITFSGNILPIFEANCTRCHGTSRQSAGLELNTYDNLIAGSQNGPVIMPGDSANSLLIEMIVSGKMPKRAEKLSDTNIQMITDWINAGALDN